jgi:hypothetical protein
MATRRVLDVGEGKFTIDITYDETKPIRTEPGELEPEPVYLVNKVEVNNTSGRQWYVLARNAAVNSFEILVPNRQTIVRSLNKQQQFETFGLSVNAVCNLG